jgi:hypothetical protein
MYLFIAEIFKHLVRTMTYLFCDSNTFCKKKKVLNKVFDWYTRNRMHNPTVKIVLWGSASIVCLALIKDQCCYSNNSAVVNIIVVLSTCSFVNFTKVTLVILHQHALHFALLTRNCCLENREYGWRDPSRWPRGTHYSQKLAVSSPTSGGLSVGIVRSRTQTMEFVFLFDRFSIWLSENINT